MEDSSIIKLFWEKSENAIRELAIKYGKLCMSISNNILSNPEDAEECVNDAYMGVWNNIPPQKPDNLQAYVCKIVKNLSIKKYRFNSAAKRNSHFDVALDELVGSLSDCQTAEDGFMENELGRLINEFLKTLDKENRVMFVKRYWFATEISELAEIFSLSENAIYVRLNRTRNKLKEFLKKEGFFNDK